MGEIAKWAAWTGYLLALVAFLRNGLNIRTVTVAGFLFYFYPILSFQNIYWFDNQFSESTVSSYSRVLFGIVAILYSIWAIQNSRAPSFRDHIDVQTAKTNEIASLFLATIGSLLLIHLKMTVGGDSKVDLMANISYELTIFEAGSIFFFISANRLGGPWRHAVAIILCIVSLYAGFRFVPLEYAILWILFHPIPESRKAVPIVAVALIAAILLIGSKLFFYQIPTPELLTQVADQLDDTSSLEQVVSLANAESSTVSVSANEVIKSNMSLPASYAGDLTLSIIPAARLIGAGDAKNFADYMKAALPIDGVDSFASPMYAFAFAALGPIGILIFCILHISTVDLVTTLISRKAASSLTLLYIYFISGSAFYFHRNDLIYNLTLIKSGIFVIVTGYIVNLLRKPMREEAL